MKKMIQSIDEDECINRLIANGDENWMLESIVESMVEGKRREIYATQYERNSNLRKKAIELYGMSCEICGFDFEKIYGQVGKGL